MSQEELKELQKQVWQIDDEIMSLLSNRGEKDYLDYLTFIYSKYFELLKEFKGNNKDIKISSTKINNYKDKILKVIQNYLQGEIVEYIRIAKSLLIKKKTSHNPTATFYAKDYRLDAGQKLYRCRRNEDEYFETMDLFHVPFDKRGKVSTMRFSVPGFPCLYMGSSPYCCWQEVNKPSAFTIGRMKCMCTTSALDMRFKVDFDNNEKDIENYLLFYPFRIACSIPIREEHENDNFKAEYILPQLLLHISIIDNDMKSRFDGILATSTKFFKKPNIFNNIREADNFIFPAKNMGSKLIKRGYSKLLEEHFEVDSLYDSHSDKHGVNRSIDKDYWRNMENDLSKNKK